MSGIIREIYSYLVWPFRALIRGHVLWLIYWGLLLGVTFFAGYELIYYASEYLLIVEQDIAILEGRTEWLLAGLLLLMAIATVPIFFVSIGVPATHIWLKGKLPFGAVLGETFAAYSRSLRTLILVIQASTLIFLAPIAMIAVFALFAFRSEYYSVTLVYAAGCLLACGIGYMRALPIYFAPLVSVCCRLEPETASYSSIEILRPKSLQLSFFLALGLIAVFGAMMGINTLELSSLEYDIAARATVIAVIAWYFVSVISLFILEEFQTFQARVNAQDLSQAVPIHSAEFSDVSHEIVETQVQNIKFG